jgi:hypothetical protein
MAVAVATGAPARMEGLARPRDRRGEARIDMTPFSDSACRMTLCRRECSAGSVVSSHRQMNLLREHIYERA